jgi:hypothetical protein
LPWNILDLGALFKVAFIGSDLRVIRGIPKKKKVVFREQ